MDKIFTTGLWFKEWAEPMPKFIKGKISIKVPDFIFSYSNTKIMVDM